MEWKCSKCGMPNFEENVCKLCGTPKPETPEEEIERNEEMTPEETEPAFEPVVIEYGPKEEDMPVSEEAPMPEETPAPETEILEAMEESAPEEESEIEEEPEAEPIPVVADEPEIKPEETAPLTPAPKTKPKKRSKLPIILLIWALIIAAAAYYLFVLKADLGQNDTQTQTSVPAISGSEVPFAEPSIEPEEPEISEEPEAPEEAPIPEDAPLTSVSPAESEPPATVVPSPAPVTTPSLAPVKTPAPTKTPVPAPKVTKKYKIYTSNDYSFYAAYPVDFSEKANLHNESLLHLASYEDKVDMVIGGTKNWKKLSAKAALNQFLSYFSGTVVESSSGSTWYSATVNENGRVTRRKAFVKNGNICYIEFTYQESDEAEFLPCMNYVLDNFILMK